MSAAVEVTMAATCSGTERPSAVTTRSDSDSDINVEVTASRSRQPSVSHSSSVATGSTGDTICFDTQSIFSEQQRKEVIDDILSETIPDLAEFLPLIGGGSDNLNLSSNTSSLLPDDELLLSLFP
jgi:hypothetical protein